MTLHEGRERLPIAALDIRLVDHDGQARGKQPHEVRPADAVARRVVGRAEHQHLGPVVDRGKHRVHVEAMVGSERHQHRDAALEADLGLEVGVGGHLDDSLVAVLDERSDDHVDDLGRAVAQHHRCGRHAVALGERITQLPRGVGIEVAVAQGVHHRLDHDGRRRQGALVGHHPMELAVLPCEVVVGGVVGPGAGEAGAGVGREPGCRVRGVGRGQAHRAPAVARVRRTVRSKRLGT